MTDHKAVAGTIPVPAPAGVARWLSTRWTLAAAAIALAGCGAPPRNTAAIVSYYRYDFTTAREALRADADRNDQHVLLNNIRLGLAALADGDPIEAERAIARVFELLSTAGLNADRTTAAVLIHEGVRIWKGEPFEQALAYYWTAALYATLGDWENVRAAAANALFRLTDFGADQNAETLARRAAADPTFLDHGYRAVDTNFALGFLMQAIGSDLSGAPGADEQLDAAVKINPKLAAIAETLRSRRYNCLLLVDYGKGPTKIAYGPDEALVKFVPQEHYHGPLVVVSDGLEIARTEAVCDVDALAADHRWNNLEDVRRAKSLVGNMLLAGGAVVFAGGGRQRSGRAQLAGIAIAAAGLLTKAGARADTRYLEFAPQSMYLVPLLVDGRCQLTVAIDGDGGSSYVLGDFEPGTPGAPRAVYLRLHGPDSPDPRWLRAPKPVYGNDFTPVRRGDFPWILGGHDVSAPNRRTLTAYQANDYLIDFTVGELRALYVDEGIRLGSGPTGPQELSSRHILEGGWALFTPQRFSMGYKRLMFSRHPAYQPTSRRVRDLARQFAAREHVAPKEQ